MSIYLYRLARWCFRHRRAVLASWLVVGVAAVVIGMASGGKTTDGVTIPGTESQRLVDVLKQELPAASGASTQVVFATTGADITAGSHPAAVGEAINNLRHLPQVAGVSDPFQTGAVSPDKHVALVTVTYTVPAEKVDSRTVDDLSPAVAAARADGVQVEFGGAVYPHHKNTSAEVIGLIAALVILVLTFGSFVAGGLPILTALVGVAISMMGITVLASVMDVAGSATSVATMLGLSCGIDYALFILSRHRGYILAGHDPEEAAGRAAGTAGSSVLFAGLSVIIALCGLAVVGIPFLAVMGLVAAATVALALLVALTLLPAVFGFAGERGARFSRLPLLRRAQPAAQTAVHRPERLIGTRWAAWVVRHRVAVLVAGVLALGALALPASQLSLGLPGADSRPVSDTSRVAADLTKAHFGPGYNGTLTVLAEGVAQPAQARQISAALARLPGVGAARVGPVTGGIALITVVPTTGPADTRTADLVHRIRNDRAALAADTGAHLMVGGLAAADIDVSAKLSQALPVFLVVVVGLAFVLLTFAFGTILVPLKSILGFLLSAGAALGVQVAVFQWGWARSLFGIEPGQTLSFLPVILLAIIFGLSSDYEVFVVSRIKEHFTRTGDAPGAAVAGAGISARVVTSAALIMASIFIAVLFDPDPALKAVGFSFTVGVLVDAFVVRLTLVPAVMAIAGPRIWYHPRWYGRLVPDPDIEGDKLETYLEPGQDRQPAGAGRSR